MTDAVNSPQHYQHLPGIEVIDITEHLGFCMGNVVKYVLRADHKGKPLEDLRKAAWYLDREIARREAEALALLPQAPDDEFHAFTGGMFNRSEDCGLAFVGAYCDLPKGHLTDEAAFWPTISVGPLTVQNSTEEFCEPAQDWHPTNIDCVHCDAITKAADADMTSEQFIRGDE